jgi:DNA-binding winged helix-turn-helix (wHTH) protein
MCANCDVVTARPQRQRQQVYVFGPFELDKSGRRLRRDGVTLNLPPKAFDVLTCLLDHAGQLLTKQALFDLVWRGAIVSDNALMQAIRQIRLVLDDDAANPKYLETVPRAGYRFDAAHVQLLPATSGVSAHATREVLTWSRAPAPAVPVSGGRMLYLQGTVGDQDLLRRYEDLLRAFVATLRQGSRVTLAIVEDPF